MGMSEYTKKEGYRESSHLRMQSDCKKEKGRVTEETRNGREVHSGAEEKACVCRAEGGQECRHGGEEAEAAFKQQVLRGEIIGGFQPQLHIRRALGGVRGVQCFRYIRITAGGTLASVETKICHVVPVCSRS